MKVSIGKGLILDVDLSKFGLDESTLNPVASYALANGLHNILMDANASVTVKDNPTDWSAKSLVASQKKLNAMYAGDVRAMSAGGGRTSDPVMQEAKRMAFLTVRDLVKKMTPAALVERYKANGIANDKKAKGKYLVLATKRWLESHPDLIDKARVRVEENRALGKDEAKALV